MKTTEDEATFRQMIGEIKKNHKVRTMGIGRVHCMRIWVPPCPHMLVRAPQWEEEPAIWWAEYGFHMMSQQGSEHEAKCWYSVGTACTVLGMHLVQYSVGCGATDRAK